jgi:hypothetical protein
MNLGFIGHSDAFCPSGIDIGQTERPGMIAASDDQATAVVHQIDLTEPRLVFCPVSPGANGNAVFEQRARFGESPSLSGSTLTSSSESVHRSWTDHEKLLVAFGTYIEAAGFVQSRQLDIHRSSQPFGADVVEEVGQGGYRIGFFGTVPPPSWSPDGT